MSRLTKRKCKAILFYVICWLFAIMCPAALLMYGNYSQINLQDILSLSQLSLLMGLSHGIYDVVILQDEMDKRPIISAFFIRSFFFLAAILANVTLCILIWSIDKNDGLVNEKAMLHLFHFFKNPHNNALVVALFIISHLITFTRSVHKKFGTRVFINTLLGKNQIPKEEDLIFMFIDMKNSTTIAEELGHFKYSNFIRDYYRLLSNCCEENQGEIYQIAGDGVFLTWKTKKCLKKARPLDCFYDLAICLKRTQAKFLNRYGVAPSFKAAAHCGKVISTEVGNFGSEMAYHGDVLNTTSRIQSLCSQLGEDFIVSERLFKKLPPQLPHNFKGEKVGYFDLKGKKQKILLFSLELPLTTKK